MIRQNSHIKNEPNIKKKKSDNEDDERVMRVTSLNFIELQHSVSIE